MAATALLYDLPAHPLVTVVLPAFNESDHITDAITSVRESTYGNWTCIVVDDGSSDDTLARATAAAGDDARFTFRAQANNGQISAINHATRYVRGDIVALLDADDIFLPDKLARAVAALRLKPLAGLLTHRMYVGDNALNIVGIMPMTNGLPDGDFRLKVQRMTSNSAQFGTTSGMLLRRGIFEMIFPADAGIKMCPDELVRRIAPLAAEVAACEDPLGIRRVHGRNFSDSASDALAAFVGRTLNDSRLMRAKQQQVASRLAIELPSADLDMDLREAVLARLEAREDAGERCATVLASSPFRELSAARRLYWRVALACPRPLFRFMVRQLYGASRLKLILNRFWLHRLRRAGVIPAVAPRPELTMWGVTRRALSVGRTPRRG
jgi:glycosyltransferase involved in cell wall biosynthesis